MPAGAGTTKDENPAEGIFVAAQDGATRLRFGISLCIGAYRLHRRELNLHLSAAGGTKTPFFRPFSLLIF